MNLNVDWATFILSVIVSIVSVYIFFFVKRRHRPNMKVELVPYWIDYNEGLLCLKIIVSSLHDKFAQIKSVQLQYLEHPTPIAKTISEFIPFTEKYYKKMYLNNNGNPSDGTPEWRMPVDILETTEKLEPQEIICVERLIRCKPKALIQIGLQVKSAKTKDSWTTTCFAPHTKSQ